MFLDLSRIQYLPLNHAARQVVIQENGSGVKHVMIGGRFVVRDGRVLTVDYARLRDEVERANDRLHLENDDAARLGAPARAPGQPILRRPLSGNPTT